ncbi:MAG: choice-of-anchor tandem repeat NxxGxxAF-containing protein [Planctomycetota bacterium]
MSYRAWLKVVLSVFAVLGVVTSVQGQSQTKIIALAGGAAPDGNGTFTEFASLRINGSGQVAFTASLDTPVRMGGSGVFRSTPGAPLEQLIRSGTATPDRNGVFDGFGAVSINNVGHVAFEASLDDTAGTNTDDNGIFVIDGSTPPVQIVREGNAAPDGNGRFASVDRRPTISDNGVIATRVAFTATDGGDVDRRGFVAGTDEASLSQIVRGGDAAPRW